MLEDMLLDGESVSDSRTTASWTGLQICETGCLAGDEEAHLRGRKLTTPMTPETTVGVHLVTVGTLPNGGSDIMVSLVDPIPSPLVGLLLRLGCVWHMPALTKRLGKAAPRCHTIQEDETTCDYISPKIPLTI